MLVIKKFQNCNIQEIEMILSWRNHETVRLNMLNSNIISLKEHIAFIKSLEKRNDKDYRIVIYNNIYLGVIDLISINEESAELGIYKNPELREKGIGGILMEGINIMSKQHNLKTLTLRVLKTNSKAVSLYIKQKFFITNEDDDYIYMKKKINIKTLIVAELSANHDHDIEVAKKSIKSIFETGADAVKIQTYTPDTITIDCDNEYFKINKGSLWDGQTLYNLYQEAYTPWEWHSELRDYAESLGLIFFSTPFDFTAVDYLEKMGNPIYKIASFEITDIPLIEYAASKGKPMIISTGIAEIQEIQEAVEACHKVNNYNVTLLKCTSSYPAPVEEANLKTMVNMKETFGVKVGLSDHTEGKDVAIAAVALGAEVVEKHFIIDKAIGGPDASFSMEPKEFKEMVTSIRNIEKAIGKVDYTLSERSKKNREFSRSLFVVEDIRKGEIFTSKNVKSIRPGNGISPKHLNKIIGKKALVDIKRGTPVNWSFFELSSKL